MTYEVLQFAVVILAVVVAFAAWLGVIYLPRRTLEHRYDPVAGEEVEDRKRREREASQSGSDRTR